MVNLLFIRFLAKNEQRCAAHFSFWLTEQVVKLAALVDDYLDAQQMFLESQGMVEYEE